MMDMFILLTLLQMLCFNDAYDFNCPSQAHWQLRAKSMCKATTNYTCLFDINYQINVYRDRCNRPRILGPGYKYVFQPNLNRAACSGNRYQPFNFETVGYSDCTYQKSLCNSQGQETYDNSNTRSDTTCICNTDRGYTFVRNWQNRCYCNPSTDDCFCYLGINPKNETVGLMDIKCYDDLKMTRSPFLVDWFNKSKTSKVIKFDNYKYNINCLPTNEYRTKAAISVLTLLFAYLAVCMFVYTFLPRWIQFRKKIKKQKLDYGRAAIKDRKEKRHYVRIQVIGKEGVGKSSLVRRLVGESIMKLNSTDGVDIVKKCQIRTTDGKWVIGKDETERNKIMKRIQEAVRKDPRQNEPVDGQVIPREGEENEKEPIISSKSLSTVGRKQENEYPTKDKKRIASPGSNTVEKSLTGENKVNIGENVPIVAEKCSTDIPNENDGVLSKDIKKADDLVKTDDMRKKITEQMDKILLEIQKDQDKMTSESLVECGLWDFAGQKDYYATHQTFLNPHAIYLLVTNILDDLTTIEYETDFDSIEEYIDFWFDSIHCLSTSSSEMKKHIPKGYPKHRLYPPVIVVCTHIDEYKTVKEFEKRKTEYIERFEEIFGGQDKANHNRGIHFISNTEFFERDCKKLKDKIYEVAKETMFFEEELPAQWIQLENALSVLKHESKQNILSFQNIVELSKITFIGEKQLLPFLTYQHKIGNIIFFEDIKEYIILQPEWLVKCFRCLVCDDHEFKRNHEIVNSTDWQHLQNTGQLSDDIIDRLFEKEPDLEFGKYKTHILHVMEKFDILVKPKFIDTKADSSLIPNSYYMPCMIKQQSTSLDIIKNMFEGEKGKFSFSPWLILEFKFLPLAYFNHILFYYITRYKVCEKAGQKTLYRGKTLVNLDETGLRKLCICFSKNAIAFQLWKLTDVEDNIYSTILVELCRKIKELKERLKQSISYDIKAKCSNGNYSNKEGRMTFQELGKMCENGHYLCPEHNEMHSKDDVEKTWLQHADIITEVKKLEATEIAVDTGKGEITLRGFTKHVSEAMEHANHIIKTAEQAKQTKQKAELVTDMVQWHYMSEDKGEKKLVEYPPEVNLILEIALNDQKTDASFYDQNGNRYIVDFNSYEEYPADDPTDKVQVLRKSKLVDHAFELPLSWEKMGDKENLKIVQLKPTDQEYKDVSQKFTTSGVIKVNFVKIERIQNKTLYQQFVAKKKSMDATNPKTVNNEKQLWHGCSVDALDSINRYGFNRSYCGKKAVSLGAGVYFAFNVRYAIQDTFSKPCPSGHKRVYLCRVLTGEYCNGLFGMRVPPAKPNAAGSHILYDSVTNNMNDPIMYIIFHDSQAFPEYLVTFKRG